MLTEMPYAASLMAQAAPSNWKSFISIATDHARSHSLFPVPVVSPQSCFTTKLLANADRYNDSQKDIIDLLMMKAGRCRGGVAVRLPAYGQQVILHGLRGLKKLTNDPHAAQVNLTEQMNIEPV